jgi:GTPase Era involved in 16S rRNA processing
MRKYLLVGRTGVGKSSFINSVFGEYIAETAEYEACTRVIEHYVYNSPWGDVCLIDTPGLAEDDIECDNKYLGLIKQKVNLKQTFATFYISRLDDTRFRPDEKRTLSRLTEHLGSQIWSRTILILTFAASVPSHRRDEATKQRYEDIRNYLRQITYNQYYNFYDCGLIDNVIEDWTDNILPISTIFKL